MADDYFGTADQMQRDSQYLHQDKRWHNACYLAGYVVEAGLKAILKADHSNPRRTHNLNNLASLVIDARLWIDYSGTLFDSHKITNSQLYLQWDPRDRYDPRKWHSEVTSDDFQGVAEYMMDVLIELHLNGLV